MESCNLCECSITDFLYSLLHDTEENMITETFTTTSDIFSQENKLDPDQPLEMKLDYDLVVAPETKFMGKFLSFERSV